MNSVDTTLSPQPNNYAVRGSNHAGMREFNERIVLQAVRQNGALPKADLARLTQLSTQTVAIIVDRLIADGLLLKHDRIRGKIGQPSVPIALNPLGALSIGVQIGRRGLEMMVCDFVGHTLHTWKYLYAYPNPHTVLAKVKEGLQALELAVGDHWDKVVGIGLAAPLSMHQWVGVLVKPTDTSTSGDAIRLAAEQSLAQWQHINVQQAVQALTSLPVEFAKDTTAACVAELLQGHGRNRRSFLYVFVGTFVGGGLVMGGHIVNGQRGNAGAIGSLPLGLATGATKPQQLLEIASGWQLEQTLIAAGLDPLLVHHDSIMDATYKVYTQPWLMHAASALAMTAASAAAFNDLEAVVIDGSLARSLMDALITQTQAAMSQYHFEGMNAPAVICGEVGRQARAKGGAWLPLHAQFFPDKDVFLKQDA
jgi:predicted NBD/HSP70 family sugar kinase